VHRLDACGDVVVKEYRRGGHVSQVVRLHHVRRGPSRGEREFRNLRAVRALGIHAPEPVAFASRGLVVYRGWLVTRLVENRGSLAALSLCRTNGLEELVAATAWQVASLIDRRVLHADLHPGNVIVDLHDVPCLLDFDRAFRFDGSPLELGRRYVGRWFRAVRKHGLPDVLGQVFQHELARAVGVRPARIHDVAPARG
jgi:3-deoxy-D-manno-octulosonic acid kinase